MHRRYSCWALLLMMSSALSGETGIADRSRIFEPLTRLQGQQRPWQDETPLNEAYRRAKDENDTLAAAALMAATGWLHHSRQLPQKALAQFERALETLHKPAASNAPERPEQPDRILTDVLGGQGKTYQAQRRAPVDLELWDPGYPPDFVATERAGERLDTGLMLNIGSGYALQGQSEIARQWWTECRAAAQKHRLPELERAALTNLAWLALQQKDKSRDAAEYLNAALKIGSVPGQPPTTPSEQLKHLWLLRGVQLSQSKRLPEAIEVLRKAVELFERSGGDERGRPLAHLGSALALSGVLDEARETYEKALALSTPDFETRWHAQCGVADIYRRNGNFAKASDAYRDCIDIIQDRAGSFATDEGKVGFLGGFQDIYDSYLEVAYAQSAAADDWTSLRNAVETLRGRSTDALIDFRERQPLGTPGLLAAYDLGLPAEPRQDVAQMAPSLPSPENVADLPEAAEDESAEAEIAKTVTFLEYYVLPQRTLLIVRTPAGAIRTASSIGRDRLRSLVQRYRRGIGQDPGRGLQLQRNLRVATTNGNNPASAAADLYRALMEPVKSLLPGPENLLVIVPHDVLWEVPFEALPAGAGQYVVDRHLIAYASSSRQWLRQAAAARAFDHRNARAWVIGNPRIAGPVVACGRTARLSSLPGAEEEARSIAAQIGSDRADLFTGMAADRMRFLAWHPNYSVIHIAAHGFACPANPNESGLVLSSLNREEVKVNAAGKVQITADPRLAVELIRPETAPERFAVSGLLTAKQIAMRFRFQADLVFLSACQSGAGPISGEGLLGFARAFEGAGARSLVSSLWLVGDQSARLLTTEFYTEYLKHGNKAVALRHAMQSTRKMYPRVADWAAFRLLGPAN